MKVELELDDKGEFLGELPTEINAILKRIESTAHGQGFGKGAAQAAEEAKKQIEETVRAKLAEKDALAPLEKQKYADIDEKNTSLQKQLLELSRSNDKTLKDREESHARELLDRAEALKKRNAKIVDLTKTTLKAEALRAGARDESLEELEVILHAAIGYDDDMEPFVKNLDGTAKLVHGKAQPLAAFVKDYLDGHAHHRKPASGVGGGARGGASLRSTVVPASVESARSRVEAGDRSPEAINELFLASRKKAS